MKKKPTINIDLEYAKNLHKVLENHIALGYGIVSYEIKNIVSKEAYDKLDALFMKYHNANCGPFNRYLQRLIEEKEEELDNFNKKLNEEEK